MQDILCVGLFLPLVSFLILLASSFTISRRLAGLIACTSIFISFLCFASLSYLYITQNMQPLSYSLFDWIPFKGIETDFKLLLDPLSFLMTLIITGVGFLIHVYSIGYMDHEKDYARYFACLNLFVFAMLLLVLAGNLVLLFVGWEGVGLASYLLIGFYYDRPSAAQAATKAFVVNRIGDAGLLIGLLLTFYLFGTTDIAEISRLAKQNFIVDASIITLLTFLYFWGATGKSAQLPLYTWLPDAMEGPTPVSALIHAATMVTAGVYLVVRMHDVFLMSPTTLSIIGGVCAVSSLFAALCALSQTDLKRVLAYSTMSQLGLMFLACAVGAFYAAMFHLMSHAFVKALLFLSAGNVVHMMHGTTEMGKMGGLSKIFTKTHWLFLIGVLALSGIPPLSAFFSKELILEQDFAAGFNTLFIAGFVVSMLTAFYLTRAYCLTFTGPSHLNKEELATVKEAPPVMLIPVAILALLSIVGGFFGFSFDHPPSLETWLEGVGVTLVHGETSTAHTLFTLETWIAAAGGMFFILLAAVLYTRYRERLGKPFPLFNKSFYVNEIYWNGIVRPLAAFASWITQKVEPKVFDGLVVGTVQATQKVAHGLQHMQSGQIRSYIAWMVLGMAFLIVYFVF